MFQVRFWLESGKILQEHVYFIFTFFEDIPFFFSMARSTAGEDGTEKISAPVSALYMTFGSQGWTALFDLVDTVGPKV